MALQLSQRTGVASRVSITLRSNARLEIEKRNGLSTARQELPLSFLSPDLVHARGSLARWVSGGVAAVLLAALSVIATHAYPAASGAAYAAAAALALAALICALLGYRAYRGTYRCRQAATGAEVFSIRATPNGKRFVESLRETIKETRYDEDLSAIRRSEQHKKQVEFLLGEGVLTPNEFASIMSRMERKASLARLRSVRA